MSWMSRNNVLNVIMNPIHDSPINTQFPEPLQKTIDIIASILMQTYFEKNSLYNLNHT